jgi:DNA-binding NtrC family response regulator
MPKPIVLVFGKDEILHHKLKTRLARHGFTVSQAQETSYAIHTFDRIKPNLIIIYSTRKNSDDKLKIVEDLRKIDRFVPIILSTRYSSEARAISALRAGVNDYFRFPISSEEFLLSAKNHVLSNFDNTPTDSETREIGSNINQNFIGDSKPMREIKSYLQKVAKSDSTVFITGETGTGKEIAAGQIHFKSPRRNKPLVCVNCAALPVGLDMPPYAQAKILRSIENKEFSPLGGRDPVNMNARVIAATNQDPERLVLERNFRKDLYYRLNVARVHMPPLRERKEDIPQLVKYTIQRLNLQCNREVQGLTDEAMSCLLRYDWPGNVRELINILEAAYIYLPTRENSLISLPKSIKKQLVSTKYVIEEERNKIISALLETNWNKSTAAKNLEWSRMTLYRKMGKYNIVETRNR